MAELSFSSAKLSPETRAVYTAVVHKLAHHLVPTPRQRHERGLDRLQGLLQAAQGMDWWEILTFGVWLILLVGGKAVTINF